MLHELKGSVLAFARDNTVLPLPPQACSRVATCSYIILTGDSPREGYCYAKKEPMVFHLQAQEFPSMAGITRLDLVGLHVPLFLGWIPRHVRYKCMRRIIIAIT